MTRTSDINPSIFISYRRNDSAGHAGHLYADLARHFGVDAVFMDSSGIEGGEDFVQVIADRLATCQVMIVVIGRHWRELFQENSDPADDWVRLEILTAIEKRIPVVPILVDHAERPRLHELPSELGPFARLNPITVRDDRWALDLEYLIKTIEKLIPRKRSLLLAMLLALLSLTLAGALSLCLYFAFMRRMISEPDANGRFHLPPALMARDEVIIDEPRVNTSAELLLSHLAEPSEEILVKFQRAQLSQATIQDLELDPAAASQSGTVAYASAGAEQAVASRRPCTTTIEVRLKDKKVPDSLHFFQTEGNGGGRDYRDVEMKSTGMGLVVVMNTNPASGEDDKIADKTADENGPGCNKHLIDNKAVDHPFFGPYSVEGLTPADSQIQFRYTQAPSTPLWKGEDGALTPFVFGSANTPEDTTVGLEARAVRIKSLKNDDNFEVRSVDEANLLRLDSFSIGSKQIQLSVSGDRAFTTRNGRDTVGLRERFRRYPLTTTLLGLADLIIGTAVLFVARRYFRGRTGMYR
ncbi:MAG TPA: toll/interleukin-1 receptor domain-containing protein [Pyrinomonadaceae bacterium]